jgi:hypothetical protein
MEKATRSMYVNVRVSGWVFISACRGPTLWTISLSIYGGVRNAAFYQTLCKEYNLIRVYDTQGKGEMAVLPFIARNSNLEDPPLAGTVDEGETSTSVLSRI